MNLSESGTQGKGGCERDYNRNIKENIRRGGAVMSAGDEKLYKKRRGRRVLENCQICLKPLAVGSKMMRSRCAGRALNKQKDGGARGVMWRDAAVGFRVNSNTEGGREWEPALDVNIMYQ